MANESSPAPVLQSVLLIDDSRTVRIFVAAVLGDAGYRVRVAASAREGVASMLREVPDILLLDVGLPDADPQPLVAEIRQLGSMGRPVIFMFSGEPEPVLRALSDRCGAEGYLEKTHDAGALVQALREAWARLSAHRLA